MKQRESGLPFDDIRNLVSSLAPLDEGAKAHTSTQLAELPKSEMGKLADICEWLSACSGRSPSVTRPLVTLFAGTHALENRLDGGDSAAQLLDEVTSISAGGALVNRLCAQFDMGLKVFDLALQIPVEDISEGAALDEKGCAGTIAFGMEAIAGGADLLCLASLDETIRLSNIAIFAVLMGADIDALLALRGSNYPEEKDLLSKAIGLATLHKDNPLEVLRRVGGRETAALCGAILSARTEHIPLIVNGSGALAAASVLHSMNPSSLDHVMYGSAEEEQSLQNMHEALGLSSILGSDLTYSDTSGLVLAGGMAKSACCLLSD